MYEHPVRLAVYNLIRDDSTFIKVDRGLALYIAGGFTARPIDITIENLINAWFRVRQDGGHLFITPLPRWVSLFVEQLRPPGPSRRDPATHSLLEDMSRFQEKPVGEANDYPLWIRGLKLLELEAAEGQLEAYDRAIREAAALAQRSQEGGGALYACAICYSRALEMKNKTRA